MVAPPPCVTWLERGAGFSVTKMLAGEFGVGELLESFGLIPMFLYFRPHVFSQATETLLANELASLVAFVAIFIAKKIAARAHA